MAQVEIEINGRAYRITCDDGQEPRLQRLAEFFNRYVTGLGTDLGQIGDARLMLLAALSVCDEVFDLRERLIDLEGSNREIAPDTEAAASRAIEAASKRVRELADTLQET